MRITDAHNVVEHDGYRVNRITRSADEAAKQPTNVSLSEALLAQAKALGINVARACARGLAGEVREEKARRWQQQNAAGFEAWNPYVQREGVPLAKYRKF